MAPLVYTKVQEGCFNGGAVEGVDDGRFCYVGADGGGCHPGHLRATYSSPSSYSSDQPRRYENPSFKSMASDTIERSQSHRSRDKGHSEFDPSQHHSLSSNPYYHHHYHHHHYSYDYHGPSFSPSSPARTNFDLRKQHYPRDIRSATTASEAAAVSAAAAVLSVPVAAAASSLNDGTAATLAAPRIKLGNPQWNTYDKQNFIDDVFIVPSFFGKEQNLTMYYDLWEDMNQLHLMDHECDLKVVLRRNSSSNKQQQQLRQRIQIENPERSKIFKQVVHRLCEYFHIHEKNTSTRVYIQRQDGRSKISLKAEGAVAMVSFGSSCETYFQRVKPDRHDTHAQEQPSTTSTAAAAAAAAAATTTTSSASTSAIVPFSQDNNTAVCVGKHMHMRWTPAEQHKTAATDLKNRNAKDKFVATTVDSCSRGHADSKVESTMSNCLDLITVVVREVAVRSSGGRSSSGTKHASDKKTITGLSCLPASPPPPSYSSRCDGNGASSSSCKNKKRVVRSMPGIKGGDSKDLKKEEDLKAPLTKRAKKFSNTVVHPCALK